MGPLEFDLVWWKAMDKVYEMKELRSYLCGRNTDASKEFSFPLQSVTRLYQFKSQVTSKPNLIISGLLFNFINVRLFPLLRTIKNVFTAGVAFCPIMNITQYVWL